MKGVKWGPVRLGITQKGGVMEGGTVEKGIDPSTKGNAIKGKRIDQMISLANGDISPESSPQPLILLYPMRSIRTQLITYIISNLIIKSYVI